jgi:hypothetical protein
LKLQEKLTKYEEHCSHVIVVQEHYMCEPDTSTLVDRRSMAVNNGHAPFFHYGLAVRLFGQVGH